ncbi:uncharacterized protein BXZ73DRAFT_21439, partial [Epithele typhae]|uniref:uncharacterized protein n=1 Tax=Epithele typhae TaxID=378194 RepID=UPI0020072ADC
LLKRDGGSGGPSTSTIIIIAVVVGAVLILVFALFAWRLLARCCRSSASRKVPLPPVQDLARHREQQVAAYADRKNDRPTTWVDPDLLHPRIYSRAGFSSGSSASLIRGAPEFSSHGQTRESSWALDDASREGSPHPLSPPTPSYLPSGLNLHNSMSSTASLEQDVLPESGSDVPMVASPSEMTHSVESSNDFSSILPARPRPPRTSRSRVRQMSIASSSVHSLHGSTSAPNVLHGAPHSIHSNINIVLPAPLAPELYPHGQHPLADAMSMSDRQSVFSNSVTHSAGSDRKSVADQWLLAGTRPPSTVRVGTLRTNQGTGAPRHSYTAAPRPPTSSTRTRSQLSRVSSHSSVRETEVAVAHRRTASQPPSQILGSQPSASPASHSRAPSLVETVFMPRSPMPPVPRIPSMYGREQVP